MPVQRTDAPVSLGAEFKRRPVQVPADYAKAGFVPADRFVIELPPGILPDVAVVMAHCPLFDSLGRRVVTIELRAAGLTDQEEMGAHIVFEREKAHACHAVSRREALRAFEAARSSFVGRSPGLSRCRFLRNCAEE